MDWEWLLNDVRTVLLGGLTVAVGAAIIYGANRIRIRIFGTKPDFILRRHAGSWEIQRTRRRTAYDLSAGIGTIASGSALFDLDVQHRLGDLEHSRTTGISIDAEYVWFTWIDRHRYYSRSVPLKGDTESIEIRGIRVRPGEPIRT